MAQKFIVQPPPPFQVNQVQLSRAWKTWKQLFLIYLDASDYEDATDKKKVSLLLHAIGPDGIELYNNFSFPAADAPQDGERPVASVPTFAQVIKKFDDHFQSGVNVHFERFLFLTRDQEPGETADQYATALRTLASTCQLAGITDSLVLSRLICGLSNRAVKERLLRTRGLDLPSVIDACRAAEVAKDQLRVIEKAPEERVESVNIKPTTTNFKKTAGQASGADKCSRCGYLHGSRRCPANGKTCHVCKGTGHFASMCRSKKSHVQVVQTDDLEELSAVDFVSVERGLHPENQAPSDNATATVGDTFLVGSIEGEGATWRAQLLTNGVSVSYKLDTGAQANIVPYSTYQSFSPKPRLHPAKTRLLGYGATEPLAVKGQCVCDVELAEGGSRKLRFFVLAPEVKAQPLLGLQACEQLELLKRVMLTTLASTPLEGIRADLVARDYLDLFDGVGCMAKQEYTIRLQDGAQPYAQATARKIPYQLYDKVRLELQRMLQLGVITEVTEPTSWVSPMVIVPKKNDSVRICVDYTKLNQSVQRERFQLPLAGEIFAKLHGAKFFTTLDAATGFWQIPLTESCSSLTTFITPFGRYRFTRLPFGISSGPEVFHRSMQQVLEGIEGADCFIDDILVWGATKEEHDLRLRKVFEKLRDNNVKLQPLKCVFRRQEVTYYGHVISDLGVKPDENKVKAISEMKPPTNREELRRLLGLVAYVAKFLPSQSHVTAPLRELLREDIVWSWTPAQDEAFRKLKKMIVTAPVLAFYSQTAPTIVAADASSYGVGAVMYQVQEDGRRAPIVYVSRTLTDAERRYSQIEKEALAMTWACGKFHCYLYGSEKPFVVETDHQPLKAIMNVQQLDECPPRLMRMKLRMMQYSYKVEYVPGKKLVVADALSRSPIPLSPEELPDYSDRVVAEIVEEHVLAVTSLWPASDRQLQRIRMETLKDPQLAALLKILHSQWPETKAALAVEVRGFWDNRHLFSQVDGLLLRGTQIIIPRTMRTEMLKSAHEGHLGIAKTKARIREVLWWPDMNNHLTQMLAECAVCAQCQDQQRKEPLQSTPLPGRPWEKLAVDLFEWEGAHYVLVVDYYSRFPELRKLSSTRAANVITAMKEIFACHGVPCEVISDNGPQFSCREFGEFARQYGFHHSTSSPRYPQGNGLVERCVRTVKDMLTKVRLSQGDFHLALLSYRTTPHATTTWSPAQLLMSRQLRTTLPTSSSRLKPVVVSRTVVSANDQSKKEQQAKYYNRRHGARELTALCRGNQVLVWDIEHRDWRIPATVIKVVNERSFLVRLSGGSTLRRNRHQLKLRPMRDGISASEDDFGRGENRQAKHVDCREQRRQELEYQVQERRQGQDCQIQPESQEASGASGQVTRSGREVRLPVWRKDYD